jgi:DNA primase
MDTKLPDLVNLMEAQGLALKKSGRGYIANCPFHDDRNPSLSVYTGRTGTWQFKCWGAGCQKQGNVVDFAGYTLFGDGWKRDDKSKLAEAMAWLTNDSLPVHAPRPTPPARDEAIEPTPRIRAVWELALGHYANLFWQEPEALAYARSRGFSDETLRRYRFGWCPPGDNGRIMIGLARLQGFSESDLLEAGIIKPKPDGGGYYETFRSRITFADRNLAGIPVYILGRTMGAQEVKYLGLPVFAKPLMMAADIPPDRKGPLFLLEGPWDVLTLRQWGYDAVAISGSSLSLHQAEILNRMGRPVIPVQDNEEPEKMTVFLERLKERLPSIGSPLMLPKEVDGVAIKDPNDLDTRLPPGKGKETFDRLARRLGGKRTV